MGAGLYLWVASAGRQQPAFAEPTGSTCTVPTRPPPGLRQGLQSASALNFDPLEAQIAIAELARRYPRLRLAPGQHFTFHPNISFRGPQTLKVRSQ